MCTQLWLPFASWPKMTQTRTSVLAIMLLLIITSCLWQVSRSAILTPNTTLSACPGGEVVVKCYEPESTRVLLRWIITLENNMIPVIELFLSGVRNSTQRQEAGLQFYSELTSYSPLTATLMTTAHPLLDGATVTCVTTVSMDTITIQVTETDQPEIRRLSIKGGMFEAESLTAIIEWESNSGCFNFTVSLSQPDDPSSSFNITVENMNYIFQSILYNTNYRVTVVSSSENYSSEAAKTFNFIKCEQPFLQKNVIINGYDFPALKNAQIFLSCPPGYGFPDREVISTCISEAMWSPDVSLLECQGDCGQLSSLKDVYSILMNDSGYLPEGSIVEFQCLHTPYQIDLQFTTKCLSGQWNPHPRDVCSQDNMGYGKIIVLSLGAVIAVISLVLFGTLGALFTVIINYKKGRINAMNNRTKDQLQVTESIPGSGVLTPNVSYELTKISQKQRVPHTDSNV